MAAVSPFVVAGWYRAGDGEVFLGVVVMAEQLGLELYL